MNNLLPRFVIEVIAMGWTALAAAIFLRVMLSVSENFRFKWDWLYSHYEDGTPELYDKEYRRQINRDNRIGIIIMYAAIIFDGCCTAHYAYYTFSLAEIHILEAIIWGWSLFGAITISLFCVFDITHKTIYWMFRTYQAICIIELVYLVIDQDWIRAAAATGIFISIQILLRILSKENFFKN